MVWLEEGPDTQDSTSMSRKRKKGLRGAINGKEKDAHLTGSEDSDVASIFYFGFLAFEFPAAYMIQRLPVVSLLISQCTCMGSADDVHRGLEQFRGACCGPLSDGNV